LRPGTWRRCVAFTNTNSKSVARTCHTGFQYTPVDSIATCVHADAVSQSAKASKPFVGVANVCTWVSAGPAAANRTHATTVSLCTSSPAQRG
jgi:hypothetical protein